VQKPDHAAEDHELVAQDEDLHVLSGVTAGEQHEQLDGTPQREVGELRQHQDGLPGRGSRAPPYRAVDANWQLNGHVRLCAPFRVLTGHGAADTYYRDDAAEPALMPIMFAQLGDDEKAEFFVRYDTQWT